MSTYKRVKAAAQKSKVANTMLLTPEPHSALLFFFSFIAATLLCPSSPSSLLLLLPDAICPLCEGVHLNKINKLQWIVSHTSKSNRYTYIIHIILLSTS
jgi:hypothetical protein